MTLIRGVRRRAHALAASPIMVVRLLHAPIGLYGRLTEDPSFTQQVPNERSIKR